MRLALCAVLVANAARAEDTEPGTTRLPLPVDSYLGLELFETDVREAELLIRGLLVYRGWFAPSLGPANAVSGLRLELPFRYRPDATGLGDINLLSITGLTAGHGGAGIGLATVLPTATPTSLGDGSLAIGPAAWGQISAASWLDLAALARLLFPVTGGAPTRLMLKPAIVVELSGELFLSSDAEMTIARAFSIPVNVHLGRRFGSHVVITFGPELVVAGEDRGALTLDFEIDLLP